MKGSSQYKRSATSVRESVLDKFGYLCCQLCGASHSFSWETHHIVYRSEAPKHKNIHNEANLLFCCTKCHTFLHKKKSNRDELVKERRLYLLFPEYLHEDKS